MSSKALNRNPRELAENIGILLKKNNYIDEVKIAGPGFINLFLNKSIFYECCKNVLDLKEKQSKKKNCVLGLATGSSPLSVYRELIRMHKEEGLSFKNVITFNLDEYFPLSKNDTTNMKMRRKNHLVD
mgnify:CR=1 FL=1